MKKEYELVNAIMLWFVFLGIIFGISVIAIVVTIIQSIFITLGINIDI